MNNRNRGRRRRLRVTGRFYAFITVVVVLCVLVGVMVTRNNAAKKALPFTPAANIASTGVVVPAVTLPPELDDSPVVSANPADTGSPSTGADSTGTAPTETTPADDTSSGYTAPASNATVGAVESIDDMLEANPDLEPLVSSESVDTSALSVTEGLPAEWRNILLLGSDTRNLKKISRTDTIMIASINVNDGRVKLVSIMRDLIIPITTNKGEQKNVKINSACFYGGVQMTIKQVNQLFGMNITEYVLVNFASFQKVVDILGGVKVDVTKAEMDEINKSLGQHAKIAGYDQQWYLDNKDNLSLKTYGKDTLLTGIQALGFSRIRHVGAGDYDRVSRQRTVLDSILKNVKDNASAVQIMQLATSMWGEIKTNINMLSAVGIATTVIKNGATKVDSQGRIPAKNTFVSEVRNKTSALYDCDFEANKNLLHSFIYEQ